MIWSKYVFFKLYQNLRNADEAVGWAKFITLNVYIRKDKKPQINDLNLYLKKLEERQIKPKLRTKQMTKIRVSKSETEKINDTKSENFIEINKIDQSLARLIRKKREDKT